MNLASLLAIVRVSLGEASANKGGIDGSYSRSKAVGLVKRLFV